MRIVIFASAYFDEPLWTNKQHVAARLAARGHTVLYVEPGFSRPMFWARLRRLEDPLMAWRDARARTESLRHGVRVGLGHLAVLSPMLLPLRRGTETMLRWAYGRLAATIRRFLGDCAPGAWVLLIYHPLGVRLLDHLVPEVVVYDCVDDLASQPHVASRRGVRARLLAAEARLLCDADLVLTTSPALYLSRRASNPHTHQVPNVADFAHFATAQRPVPEPPILQCIRRPRIAFVGALDPYKLDYALLEALAASQPAWSIVLAGPESTVGRHEALVAMRRHSNVHAIGVVAYDQLPAVLAHCDVLVMPYAVNAHTRHVFPLKFFEFLATGLPVVASPLPSLAEFAGVCPFPADLATWREAIAQALADPQSGRNGRIALARDHTWEHRVSQIERLIAQAVDARRAAGIGSHSRSAREAG